MIDHMPSTSKPGYLIDTNVRRFMVGTERLELSRLTALASKTSVSTNFTTSPWQEN